MLKEIEDLLKKCEEDCSASPSPENIGKMENIRNEYELLYEHLSRGAIIRSRATWFEHGEKINKYFLNLETYKKSKSCIRKVYTEDGFLTSDFKRIMKEVEVFYSSLYKKDNCKIPDDVSSSGMRNLKTHFETVCDWSVVKWSVLIGQTRLSRD